MSLKGTLADLNIVDLIQFPHSGRKTGQLIVTDNDAQALLYYDRGSLVHASVDDTAGLDALTRIVGWVEGSFEFVLDVQADVKSIDMDLHRAVMQALKLHDELKREEERRKTEKKSNMEAMKCSFLN